MNELDVTRPYISAPWEARPETGDGVDDGVQAAARAHETQDICIATSASARQSVRSIDAAWPGGHTRRMYDDLSKRQASILAQLRTDMTPLNGYLNNIKAVETNLCDCGEAPETRKHFIFRCVRWSEQRKILGVWAGEDNLSRLLGGKPTADTEDWKPDMDVVRAVIHFTLATKRFEHDVDERRRTTR